MPRSDRCANPMGTPEEKGHIGVNLRTISAAIHAKFPFLPRTAKICSHCRIKAPKYMRPSSCPTWTQKTKLRPRAKSFPDLPMPETEEHSSSDCFSDVMNSSLRSGRSFSRNGNDDFLMDEDSSSCHSDEDQPPLKQSERESELEEMLDGLKGKFNDLETYAERLQILTVTPRSWSARKIASEFDTSRYMAAKAIRLRELKGVFASPTAKASRSLSGETVEKVRNFYLENSRIMPGFKDKVSVKVNGEKKVLQKHLVLDNLKDLHQEYEATHPEAAVGFSKFAELRPKQCVLAGMSGTHTVCVCTYHENCKLMLDAINISTLTKDLPCPIKDYKDCLNRLMCDNPTAACHLDECSNCPGVEPLSLELKKLLSSTVVETVKFRVWQSTDKCTLQTQLLPMNEFVELLCERLTVLKPHHFIAREQSAFVKQRKESLDAGEVMVHCDFSENYAFVAQDAAQSFHYNNDQCTVHPVVYYYREQNDIKHKSLVVLSDSLVHDTAAFHSIQKIIVQQVKKNCPGVKKIIYVTDGAAQHYKNRFQMANLLNHEHDFDLEAEAHYFATAHGKGACDGVGAVLKREAKRKSLQITHGEPILTPDALFRWSKDHFQGIDIFFFTKEEHEAVKGELKTRFDNAKLIPGIQKQHCFIPGLENRLRIKRYSAAVAEDVFPKQKTQKQRKQRNQRFGH